MPSSIFFKGGIMDKKKIVIRALRKCGYNVDSDNFELDNVYMSAINILDESVLDIQRRVSLPFADKIADLTEIKDFHSFSYADYIAKNSDTKAYQLPADFIEYIGSTRSDVDTTIIGNVILTVPKSKYSVFSEGDGFNMRYKARVELSNFPSIMETYCMLYLALEVILTLRPDDGNRIQIIRQELTDEANRLVGEFNLRSPLTRVNMNMGWR